MNYEDQKNKQNKLLNIFIEKREFNLDDNDDIFYNILNYELIENSDILCFYRNIEESDIFKICFEYVIGGNKQQYKIICKYLTINILKKYDKFDIKPNKVLKYLNSNFLKNIHHTDIIDFLSKINIIHNKTNDSYILGEVLDLYENKEDIKLNFYFRIGISITPLLNIYNICSEEILLKKFDLSYNPFSENFFFNNDYFIENITCKNLVEDHVLKKINFKSQFKFIKRCLKNVKNKHRPRNNNLQLISKLIIVYSFDTILDISSENLIFKQNLCNKNILGILRTCFQPIAALSNFLKKNNKVFDDGDIMEFIISNLEPDITYSAFLNDYYYIPLMNDFFNDFPFDKDLYNSIDKNTFLNQEKLDVTISHLLTLKENGPTAIAIKERILHIYDDILDNLNNEFILHQIYSSKKLINLFTELVIYYPETFGKEIFN